MLTYRKPSFPVKLNADALVLISHTQMGETVTPSEFSSEGQAATAPLRCKMTPENKYTIIQMLNFLIDRNRNLCGPSGDWTRRGLYPKGTVPTTRKQLCNQSPALQPKIPIPSLMHIPTQTCFPIHSIWVGGNRPLRDPFTGTTTKCLICQPPILAVFFFKFLHIL